MVVVRWWSVAIVNPEVEIKKVSDPFMDLRLFRAATANPEVEIKTVSRVWAFVGGYSAPTSQL